MLTHDVHPFCVFLVFQVRGCRCVKMITMMRSKHIHAYMKPLRTTGVSMSTLPFSSGWAKSRGQHHQCCSSGQYLRIERTIEYERAVVSLSICVVSATFFIGLVLNLARWIPQLLLLRPLSHTHTSCLCALVVVLVSHCPSSLRALRHDTFQHPASR